MAAGYYLKITILWRPKEPCGGSFTVEEEWGGEKQ